MMFEKIKNPMLFQGSLKKKDYFEGWYFKNVSTDAKNVISLIPGISLFKEDKHCFIQYIWVSIDASGKKTTKTGYQRYPLEDFQVNKNPFLIQIGNNYFSKSHIEIDMDDSHTQLKGSLHMTELTPLQRNIFMPNIMGYFAYVPGMECYHGIPSMTHRLSGSLVADGKEIPFDDGKGYLEKDWGTSFPKGYVWIQCNNFQNDTLSLFCSAANIPFGRNSFNGFICNLRLEGKEHRFATYNGSRLVVESVDEDHVTLQIKGKRTSLLIEAFPEQSGALVAPVKGEMTKTIKEGLSGVVKIALHDRNGLVLHEDSGIMAGIEIVGDYTSLMNPPSPES
ncbi:MAG: tocopherol cyclase family protein [Clostridia bacterium]